MRTTDSLLTALRVAVPGLDVSATTSDRREYSRTTLTTATIPRLIAAPTTADQLRRLVIAAGRERVHLYPISRGRNWGYGDACAPTDGQVIVDLGRMNRIHEVHPELGYAVIEPGVTFGQLAAHLEAAGLPFWVDVTGAGPDTSVLGNTLERGYGHTPHADHYHNSAGYEVVLADGRVLTTGFGHYAGSKVTYAYKPGVGPSLDGLFTQSNLGIVTRMGVWLQPKPKYLLGFVLFARDRSAIGELIDRLRPLRQLGILPSTVHIANDLRVASAAGRFPWDRADGTSGLPDPLRAEYASKFEHSAWVGLGGLYGTRETAWAAATELKRAVRGIARVQFVDQRKLNLFRRLVRVANRFGLGREAAEKVANVGRAFGLLSGQTTPDFLLGAGWRSRKPALPGNADPLDNGWGMVCVAPIAPQTGRDVTAALAAADRVYAEYGFEPMVTVNLLTGRAACLVMSVAFDKSNPAETTRAGRCAAALTDAAVADGYHPYRCGTWAMDRLATGSETFWDVVATIKRALDPHGILAPGRYAPSQLPATGGTNLSVRTPVPDAVASSI
ncbi:MAG: FAD-binding oxidoreductase [Gemmataceae bacterium]